jgi:hypothetical protein
MFAQAEARSRRDKNLMLRLDIVVLFSCISRIVQTNIKFPREGELNINEDELNHFATYLQIAYCLALIPGQVTLNHVGPRYWLSGLEVVCGSITCIIAISTSAHQVYILKFSLELCEYCIWFGMVLLSMHWYGPD